MIKKYETPELEVEKFTFPCGLITTSGVTGGLGGGDEEIDPDFDPEF